MCVLTYRGNQVLAGLYVAAINIACGKTRSGDGWRYMDPI